MIKSGKRICAFFIMFLMTICIAGCGNSQGNNSQNRAAQSSSGTENDTDIKTEADNTEKDSTSETKQNSQTSDTTATGGTDVLVVYFSRTGEQYTVGVIDEGNTAIVAKMIAEQTGADQFEVLPVDDHYPMTYSELTDVAKQEQNDNARPEYAGELPDLSQYSMVFIGAPVWWGDWPMIMYTFFENNADELAGKALIPFSTHEGSGLSGFDSKLASVCPDSTVGEGLAIRGNDCQNKQDSVRDTVNDWLESLQF